MESTASKLRTTYAVFLGVFTVALGALYISAAADIYFSGRGAGEIYSREIVSGKLFNLLVPTVLWAVAAVLGAFFSAAPLLPAKRRDKTAALRKLRKRMPQGEGETFLSARRDYRRAERIHAAVLLFAAAVWLAAAIVSLVCLCDTARFPSADVNGEVLSMLKVVLPCFGAAFLVSAGVLVFGIFFAKRQLPKMKELLVLGKGAPRERCRGASALGNARAAVGSENFIAAVRTVLLVLGVTLFVLGLFNGGIEDVFRKAVMICTECIGLG